MVCPGKAVKTKRTLVGPTNQAHQSKNAEILSGSIEQIFAVKIKAIGFVCRKCTTKVTKLKEQVRILQTISRMIVYNSQIYATLPGIIFLPRTF